MELSRFFSAILLISLTALIAPATDWMPNMLPAAEPAVRIGLLQNASSARITATGSVLAGGELNFPESSLDTSSVSFASRPYSVPEYGIYRFQIEDIETREEADDLAAQILTDTGLKVRIASGDEDTWNIVFETESDTKEEADAFVAGLTEKGFINVTVNVEKYSSPSDDAVLLSRQIAFNPKSKVRSLSEAVPAVMIPKGIRAISSYRMMRKNMNAPITPGLRELVISGSSEASKLSTLRAFTVGSATPGGIINLNGKRYRGKMEILVNSAGRLTVVNVVPMEDYLLGVVPAELSLPQIEAQKAQAVAARTYAAANRNAYGDEGFDMVPTVWSQVYKGVAIESRMGSQAVRETRGIIATYEGKPINALYTSTCGGRTEDSGNIYPFDEPYLRGVNCSLDGKRHFVPFLIKTSRLPADIKNEANYEFVRMASRYAVNGFLMATPSFTDEFFDEPPTRTELTNWLNLLAAKFNKPFPVVAEDSSLPLKLARILHGMIYSPSAEVDGDTLMSEADIDYQLSFADGAQIPKQDRVMLAELMRDGWFSIYSNLTIKVGKPYSRAKILSLINNIYNRQKWALEFQSGTARPTEDGKLIIANGRSETEILVDPNTYLLRKFGDDYYQVKEVALVGGEKIRYKTNFTGNAVYIEIEPTDKTTVAERMSPFTNWNKRLSVGRVRSGLARYVKGMGTLIDLNVKTRGFSKRAIELEIKTTNGIHTLKGGKIRSALGLREQLFVMNKTYSSNGRLASITFTGRGWGHGIGMCQYGAYGLAQMGVKYDKILSHYYTGIELVKAY